MTDPSVRERKTKRADELKPGDVTAAGELLDNPAEVLYASTYGPNGSRPVTLLVFREVGSTRPLTDEINPAAEFELADAGEPSVWADIAAELHKLADDVLNLVGEPAPRNFSVDILTHNPTHCGPDTVASRPVTIAAVEAAGIALLGKPGETNRMAGGTFHHTARGARGPINVTVFQSVADPDEVDPEQEIARLRAENERLRAAVNASPADPTGFDYSREPAEDATLTPPGRVEPHTGELTDDGLVEVADGHVVHECCGKLDDGPHESFCARYVPPTDPADLPCQAKPLISDETIAEAAAMEQRDRLAGGPPWEVPDHPENAQPGGWHHGQIR